MTTSAIRSQNQVPAAQGFVNLEFNRFVRQAGKNALNALWFIMTTPILNDELSSHILLSALQNVFKENYARSLAPFREKLRKQ